MREEIRSIEVKKQEREEDTFAVMEKNKEYKERKFENDFFFIFNKKLMKSQLQFKIVDCNGKRYSHEIPSKLKIPLRFITGMRIEKSQLESHSQNYRFAKIEKFLMLKQNDLKSTVEKYMIKI